MAHTTVSLPPGSHLLDPPIVDELLHSAVTRAGATLDEHHLRSVHARPGRCLSHVFEGVLRNGDTIHPSLLVAHLDLRDWPPNALVLERDGHEAAVWRFPNDPWLPGLASATHPPRVRQLLDQLQVAPGQVRLLTRAYHPTRRAVVEVTVDLAEGAGRVLYLKVMAGSGARRTAAIHRALAPHVPVPRVIGVDEGSGIVALQAVEGDTLRQALLADQPVPDPTDIANLLERLATVSVQTRNDPARVADPTRHVTVLEEVVPDLVDGLREVVAAAVEVGGPSGTVHADLHDGQLLVNAGRVSGVLDVDGVGHGRLAVDAGTLVANIQSVEVFAPNHPAAIRRATACTEQLADPLGELVGASNLARAAAGAWIGLATGPNRMRMPGWREATRACARRALDWLQRC